MALLDLQQRGRELGRIRIGTTIAFTKSDGTPGRRPAKLDIFRFTTRSERNARLVADLFGGEARPWADHNGEWEVVTDVCELPVVIPPGQGLTQAYELWTRGGLQRRCNGETQAGGEPCVCPTDIGKRMTAAASGNACKPMSRLSVVLPDLMDLGVWQLTTGGYTAALELPGAADLLERLGANNVYLPATLRLEQRSKVVEGQTRTWGVPVLEVGATIRALTSGQYADGGGLALPPPPGVKQLDPGHTQPPPPEPPDDPDWRPGEADGVIDAEIVEDPEILAQTTMVCESKADVQALVDRARTAGLLTVEVTDPVSGARLVLRDLLATRWRALP